jgi:hypothetical protein
MSTVRQIHPTLKHVGISAKLETCGTEIKTLRIAETLSQINANPRPAVCQILLAQHCKNGHYTDNFA